MICDETDKKYPRSYAGISACRKKSVLPAKRAFEIRFFASGLPRQKTLLSAQVCELSAKPTVSARSVDVFCRKSRKTFSTDSYPRSYTGIFSYYREDLAERFHCFIARGVCRFPDRNDAHESAAEPDDFVDLLFGDCGVDHRAGAESHFFGA